MKKYFLSLVTLLAVAVMSGCFVSCGDDESQQVVGPQTQPQSPSVVITNRSGWTLPNFTVYFYFSESKQETHESYGDLKPGGVLSVKIPGGASSYKMTTFRDNELVTSGTYSTSTTSITLTNALLEGWGLIAAN